MPTLTPAQRAAADRQADGIIDAMITASAAGALVPVVIPIAVFAASVGAGVVSIGLCYGIQLTRAQAWQLVLQFFRAAGMGWTAMIVGNQLLAALIAGTGLGYWSAAALQATVAAALTYAIGQGAKEHFTGAGDAALGRTVRAKFASYVTKPQ